MLAVTGEKVDALHVSTEGHRIAASSVYLRRHIVLAGRSDLFASKFHAVPSETLKGGWRCHAASVTLSNTLAPLVPSHAASWAPASIA